MRADAVRNRQKLLEVAEQLFTTRGAGVEMDEIAAAAGVGVGTIYRHFATKDALVTAIVVGPVEALIADAEGLAAAADPGEAFFALFRRLIELSSAKRHICEVFARDGRAAPYGTPDELASRRDRFRAAFAALLARAQRAGAIRADVRVPELVALAHGAFPHLARDRAGRAAQRRLLALVCDGLRPSPGI